MGMRAGRCSINGITRERLFESRDELENQAASSTRSRNDKAQQSLDLHRVEKGDRP